MYSFGLSSCCVCCLRLPDAPDAAAVGFAPCFEFEIGFYVCGSRGVRRVNVLICTRAVQIGVAHMSTPVRIMTLSDWKNAG